MDEAFLRFWEVTFGLGTLVTAVLGVILGLRQLKRSQRLERLELGNLYVQRYWEIDDAMLLTEKGSDEHRRHRRRYLRLCDDEFEAARQDWLDPDQWAVWHSFLSQDSGRRKLEADLASLGAGGTEFEFVRTCLSATSGHSWVACPANNARRATK